MRQLLFESLDVLGFIVVQAEDGQAGLAELERSAPDLMILDFAMPGLNGAESPAGSRNAILTCGHFVTGFADNGALDDAVRADLPVLRKPFWINERRR